MFIVLLICVGLTLIPTISNAQISSDDGTVDTQQSVLDTVIVTAGRTQELLRTLPVAANVLVQEDIERVNPNNLGDALRYIGAQITTYGPGVGMAKITMRGFGTSVATNEVGGVLTMLDGRKLGTNNLAQVGMESIERIEVVRGTASMQYGADAIAGVINLITRRGTEKLKLMVSQTIGSADYMRTGLHFSGKVKNFDFAFGGSTLRTGDYSLPNGQVYLNTGTEEQTAATVNVGYNFTENYRLGFVYNSYNGIHGRNGGLPSSGNPAFGAITYPYGESDRDTYTYDILFEGNIPSYNITFFGRYFKGVTDYGTTTNKNTTAYTNYDMDYDGMTFQGSYENSFLSLTAGVDYYAETYYKDTSPKQSEFVNLAGYLIAKLTLFSDRLYLTGGMRYETFDMEAEPNPAVPFNTLNRNRFTPSFGIAYLPIDWLKLRGNISTAFKMPTTSQIFAGYASMNRNFVLANPDLIPEEAKAWEIGADFNFDTLTFGLTYFHTDYLNYLELRQVEPLQTVGPNGLPPGSLVVRRYYNVEGVSKFRGLEGNLQWQMGKYFDWDFDLKPYIAFTKLYKYHSDSGRLSLIADSTYNYGLVFTDADSDLDVSLDVTRLGNQLRSSGDTFGPYTVFDLHVGKDLIDFENKGKVRLRVEIYNLTNKIYEDQSNYIKPGRSFYVGLRYEY
jgi:vitamin B12 transporter